MEVWSWLSHTITAIAGIAGGRYLGFLLASRRQTSDEWQAIVKVSQDRETRLETRVDQLHQENRRLLEEVGEVRASVARLFEENKQLREENQRLLEEVAELRAIIGRPPGS